MLSNIQTHANFENLEIVITNPVPNDAIIKGEPTKDEANMIATLPTEDVLDSKKEIFGIDIQHLYALLQCIWDYFMENRKVYKIDWTKIARTINSNEKFPKLNESECQALWKFVAYDMDVFGESKTGANSLKFFESLDDLSDLDKPSSEPSVESIMAKHCKVKKFLPEIDYISLPTKETAPPSNVISSTSPHYDEESDEDNQDSKLRKKPRKKKIWQEFEDIKLLTTIHKLGGTGSQWNDILEQCGVDADLRQHKGRLKAMKKMAEKKNIEQIKPHLVPFLGMLRDLNMRDVGRYVKHFESTNAQDSIRDSQFQQKEDMTNDFSSQISKESKAHQNIIDENDTFNTNILKPFLNSSQISIQPHENESLSEKEQEIDINNEDSKIDNLNIEEVVQDSPDKIDKEDGNSYEVLDQDMNIQNSSTQKEY